MYGKMYHFLTTEDLRIDSHFNETYKTHSYVAVIFNGTKSQLFMNFQWVIIWQITAGWMNTKSTHLVRAPFYILNTDHKKFTSTIRQDDWFKVLKATHEQ